MKVKKARREIASERTRWVKGQESYIVEDIEKGKFCLPFAKVFKALTEEEKESLCFKQLLNLFRSDIRNDKVFKEIQWTPDRKEIAVSLGNLIAEKEKRIKDLETQMQALLNVPNPQSVPPVQGTVW